MTTDRLFPATSGPSSAVPFAGNFLAGVGFTVTQGGMWFQGYQWWPAPTAPAGPTDPQKFTLWGVTGTGGTGTIVPGTTITSDPLTPGVWNFIPLATPVQIAIGATYVAATGVNGNFPDTQFQWGAAQPFAGGITQGPLLAFGDGTAGGSPATPYSMPQGLFSTASTDPALQMPNAGSNSSNFWVDVQVSDTPPGGYTGSYQLFPNMFDALGFTLDLAQNYILGTEVTLSQSCALNALRFYSPAGAGQLPTETAIWHVASQTMVAGTHLLSPAWTGAAGSGWVSAPYTGVTLPAGDYKASVWNGNPVPQVFNATTVNYFTTGYGASGITAGPLTCPAVATATAPGQCTFQTSTSFVYPDQYVAGAGQNYWLDPVVTPVAAPAASGSFLAFFP